jgi:hypothetical protein
MGCNSSGLLVIWRNLGKLWGDGSFRCGEMHKVFSTLFSVLELSKTRISRIIAEKKDEQYEPCQPGKISASHRCRP